jgi:hypothetical protein
MTKKFDKKIKLHQGLPAMDELEWNNFYNDLYIKLKYDINFPKSHKKEVTDLLKKISNHYKWKLI